MKLLSLCCLLTALLSVPALAQVDAAPTGVTRGDLVRVWIAPDAQNQPPTLIGHVLIVGADSLTLAEEQAKYSWNDVDRLQRLGENRRRELVGVGLGIGVGVLVGGLFGVLDGGIAAPAFYGIVGGMVGSGVGAFIGARSNRQWEDVQLWAGSLELRTVISL